MMIRTSFPGQELRVVAALTHIAAQLLVGRTMPFIELVHIGEPPKSQIHINERSADPKPNM